MRSRFRLTLLALNTLFFGSLLLLAADPDQHLKIGSLSVGKVLILGNSITLHGPSESIGWSGNWGMAASSAEKDFSHLLLARLEQVARGKPQSLIKNIADFERQYTSYDLATGLKEFIDFQPDLIIIAIGENVSSPKTPDSQLQYRKALTSLITNLDHPGHPTFILRSSFWADPVKDGILREVSQAAGAHFVDLKGLDQDEKNFARSEREFKHAGVASHPGDAGMLAIANAIWNRIEQISSSKSASP